MKSPSQFKQLIPYLVFAFLLAGAAALPSRALSERPHTGSDFGLIFLQFASSTPTPTPTPDPQIAPTPTPTPVTTTVKATAKAPSKTATLAALSGGASLTGRTLVPLTPRTVDLSSEGVVDWAHWGKGGATQFNHKSGVTPQVSNYTRIGASTVGWHNDNATTFSWSDGTPTTSAASTPTGVNINSVGNGFEITVPADTSLKTLKLYVGLWRSQAKLEATLSDGSAPAFVDTSLINNGGSAGNAVYSISYAAASSGQTLRVRYTVIADYNAPYGNVSLEAATLGYGEDPNVSPIVGIAGPNDEGTYAAGSNITLSANALDTDGSIGKVDFYANGLFIGTGALTGTDQYSFTWNSVFAGTYSLTAVALDNQGATTTSSAVNITLLSVTGGSISGQLLQPPTPRTVNLTTEGIVDWAHWGMGGATQFNHKSGVTPQVSNYTRIGASTVGWHNDNATTFSWSDGTPTTSAASTPTGVHTSSVGNGFEFTVPADVNPRTLRLYIGLWYAQGKLEAALSDGSAPVFVDTSFSHNGGTASNGIYTLTYSAASSGQTLRIRYTVLTDNFAPYGNVSLEAATLVYGGDSNAAPAINITNPADGATINAGTNLSIDANATDSDGNINKVEFFQGSTKLGEDTVSPYSFTWNNVASGTYNLTAIATDDDGAKTTSAPARVQVNALPKVNAGDDQLITLPASATLQGSATDDGLPSSPGAVTLSWTKVSGPGGVTFNPTNGAITTATFSAEGNYVLRLTGNDGAASVSDDVAITVSTASTIKLNPAADSHVRDGSNAALNYGSAITLEAQTSGTAGENRDAYFKFDLSKAGQINSAKLRIYASLSAAGSVSTSVYPVANTTWTETGLTWNNKPAFSTPVLDTKTVSGTTSAWYELDVTNYIAGEQEAGRSTVTLALHNPSVSGQYIKINSKEATSNKPELEVVTSETAYVRSQTPGTVRNNFTGFVGMKLTVGSSPVTVTSLGRVFVNGNTGAHTVKLVTASNGADVTGGSVSVNMAAGSASNGFKYAALAAPITLAANTAYYIVSQETSGGDQWYDFNTTLNTAPVATTNGGVQRTSNSWTVSGTTNNSYVPVNFKYTVKAPRPSATYHLHQEQDGLGSRLLKPEGPDTVSFSTAPLDLKNAPLGEVSIASFNTQEGVPNRAGVIPAGSTATVSLWMKNTGTVGTMYPRVKLNIDGGNTFLCTSTGTSALTTTLTKYTLTCTTGADAAMSATNRYYLWVGVNLTAGSSTKSFSSELDMEGTLNGNYDSQITVPLPLQPIINSLSPNVGPVGSNVTITGANFKPMQGTSTVNFNGAAATVSSWSATRIIAQVPAGASTGAVLVTVNGSVSNGVTFTVGAADSDGDGLLDSWELQYFGNLNQGANDDPDGDGSTNLQESRQGRDPTKGAVSDGSGLINLKLFTPLEH